MLSRLLDLWQNSKTFIQPQDSNSAMSHDTWHSCTHKYSVCVLCDNSIFLVAESIARTLDGCVQKKKTKKKKKNACNNQNGNEPKRRNERRKKMYVKLSQECQHWYFCGRQYFPFLHVIFLVFRFFLSYRLWKLSFINNTLRSNVQIVPCYFSFEYYPYIYIFYNVVQCCRAGVLGWHGIRAALKTI